MQETMTEIDAVVLDAVSEFVNLVVGNGCTKLNMNNFKVMAEPPEIVMKEMLKKVIPGDTVGICLKTPSEEFRVFFFFSAGAEQMSQ